MDRRQEVTLPLNGDTEVYNLGLYGQCYMAAMNVAFDLSESGIKPTICHGVVTCSPTCDKPNERIMHAWVECTLDIKFESITAPLRLAVDAANPERPLCVLPVDMYHRGGEVNSKLVRRYGFFKAMQYAAILDHFGPWERPREQTICWGPDEDAMLDDRGLMVDPREGSIQELAKVLPWLSKLSV